MPDRGDRRGVSVLQSVNPATNDIVATYDETAPADAERLVARAHRAFESWSRTSFGVRAASLRKAADLLEERQERCAALMALEMGKPLAQGRAEIEKCAFACRFFADHGEEFLASEPAATGASKSYVTYRPLGVVLGVMPWNFPFWQVFRFAAPALMAGNACVLKHASNVSGCALAIGEVFRDAGFPDGLFGVLLLGSGTVARVLELPKVRAVALTGSSAAGRAIAGHAGRLIKKSVLELGGSDPYVVLDDADLDLAVEVCASARLVNAGQSCIAAKRFIVMESVRKEFTEKLVERMGRTRMGNPTEDGIEMGPLARRDLRDQLQVQVTESVRRGATLALGGAVPPGPGAYYPPTVLTGVRPGMPAFDEETFGPVAAIVNAPSEAEAVRCANESPYGLGAAVFTRDLARGERIAAEGFEAGSCFVNAQVHSDPRLPFGGVKESGYGRELSRFGIREFVNVKSVYVR